MSFSNVQGKVELFKYIKISSNKNQRERRRRQMSKYAFIKVLLVSKEKNTKLLSKNTNILENWQSSLK
jgi:hypothetical protein